MRAPRRHRRSQRPPPTSFSAPAGGRRWRGVHVHVQVDEVFDQGRRDRRRRRGETRGTLEKQMPKNIFVPPI